MALFTAALCKSPCANDIFRVFGFYMASPGTEADFAACILHSRRTAFTDKSSWPAVTGGMALIAPLDLLWSEVIAHPLDGLEGVGLFGILVKALVGLFMAVLTDL
jgi:hypothetical protein